MSTSDREIPANEFLDSSCWKHSNAKHSQMGQKEYVKEEE